jgi:hypothetical protein
MGLIYIHVHGRIQDFKLGDVHLKKLRRAEGGVNIFGVFGVKNHDFTPKNHIFFNFRGGARRFHVYTLVGNNYAQVTNIAFYHGHLSTK